MNLYELEHVDPTNCIVIGMDDGCDDDVMCVWWGQRVRAYVGFDGCVGTYSRFEHCVNTQRFLGSTHYPHSSLVE